MPEADLTGRQLDLIAHLAALQPPMFLMGGYAEEALRMDQLAELGFTEWETWGEASPGVPFYLFGHSGDLKVDV